MDNPLTLTIDENTAYESLPIDRGLDIGHMPVSPAPTADADVFTRLQHDLKVNVADIQGPYHFLGMGANGRVCKARWRDRMVAVKFFESRDNRTALLMEVRQLAVLNHESIVKLFGVAEHGDGTLCMLIEYAENGSLYDLLHQPGDRRINYTAGHAISWIRQIASAIVYLHSFKPKAIIHRDLKSPNILLTNNCLFSKLADFGTATEQRTVMTNMKGSALWMAPEVFTGRGYTTACDVYSLAICLWEVLSRRRPYGDKDMSGNSMAILWQVHLNHRPDPLSNCPPILISLMTEAWAKEPADRPTAAEVHRRLTEMLLLFPGGDTPLRPPNTSIVEVPLTERCDAIHSPAPAPFNYGARGLSTQTVRYSMSGTGGARMVVVETPLTNFAHTSTTMAMSVDAINQAGGDTALPSTSGQQDYHRGHQRGGSYDTALVFNNSSGNLYSTPSSARRPSSLRYGSNEGSASQLPMDVQWSPEMEARLNDMDEIYRPLPPLKGNAVSMKIFDDHTRLVKEAAALKQDIDDKTEERRRLNDMLKIKQQYDVTMKRRDELIKAIEYMEKLLQQQAPTC